jgi:hypothetical protein
MFFLSDTPSHSSYRVPHVELGLKAVILKREPAFNQNPPATINH